MGTALWLAQQGQVHPAAAAMRGLLSGGTEIRAEAVGGTFRLMYTAKLGEAIYVLTAFQRKSHHGATTPGHLLERVARRLAMAWMIHEEGG